MPTRVHRLTHLGWGLALPVLYLAIMGLLAVHATDRTRAVDAADGLLDAVAAPSQTWLESAASRIGPTTLRQGLYLVTGCGLLLLSLVPSYQKIGRWAFVIYGVVVALLLGLVVDRWIDLPLFDESRNTHRWLRLGGLFSIQPSEFMKPALILALARYLRYRSSFRTLPGLIPPFLLTLLPMLMILRQPDLGTVLMLAPVLLAMLFVAGARLWHLGAVVGVGIVLMPIFYFQIMHPYQRERIQVVFNQNVADDRWHMHQGYQLRQSKIALATGGVFGEGYGQGMFVQHALVPEEHNDFIFAIIGHQFGLLGCMSIILAYGLIVFFGTEIAMATNDPFGRLLAVGIIVMIVAQALLNISMTIGLAPITGMTLPFVSAGGSSLWANFIALGLLLNVAQRRPMLIAHPPFEHRNEGK